MLQQAKLASFFDAFTVLAFMAVAVLPLLFLIKYKKPKPVTENVTEKNQ